MIEYRKSLVRSLILLCGLVGGTVSLVQAQIDSAKHMGVATCASGVCHGKSAPDTESYALLNEYRTWSREDLHSKAYKVLLNADSKRIARNLGLQSAHTAKICLDCHTDNVPPDQRGPKFQISDGVGCEACHGGSEQWLDSHYKEGVSHAENVAQGLYPSESPEERASMCLTCHLGTRDKFATHRIMGAGHPRLSFELETFTANQPGHYVVDEDYRQRKGEIQSVTLWITGLYATAARTLQLMPSHLLNTSGAFPELSFYDCHGCHHAMDDLRWSGADTDRGVPAGSVRLNDSALQLLAAAASVRDEAAAQKLVEATRQMQLASVKGLKQLGQATAAVQSALEGLKPAITAKAWTSPEVQRVRTVLLREAAENQYRDYTSAEQAFLAVETLTLALNQEDSQKSALDALYKTLATEAEFSPAAFARSASSMLKQTGQ